MIRSPLHVCRERKIDTGAAVVAVTLSLLLPSLLLLGGVCARASATAWLEAYRPVVYLQSGTTDADAKALADELSGWASVHGATVRDPADAYASLVDRIGEDRVGDLGLSPDLMPTSIVVEPAMPVAGHIDLTSRITALQIRQEVESVSVPTSSAMNVLSLSGVVLTLAAILALTALLAGGIVSFDYLRRMREVEGEMNALAVLFGAYPSEVRRPTLVRGMVVGAACGVACTLLLVGALVAWRWEAAGVLGIAATIPATAWPLAAAPLLVGPIWGLVVGWLAAGRRTESRWLEVSHA